MHSSDRNLVKERRIYLKKLKKLFIITGVVFIILVLQFCVFYNSVVATQLDSANIYMVGDCGSLLRYKGVEVKVSYVQYTYEGVNYPAYCLDKTKPGAENGAYTVSVNSMIQDVGLWRRIINGYPYKSLEELGVEREKMKAYVNLFSGYKESRIWVSFTEDAEKNIWMVSIRSRKIPINMVAERHHGGGHANASGARVETYEETMQIIQELDDLLK